MLVIRDAYAKTMGLSIVADPSGDVRTKTWPTWAEIRADPFLYARHLSHQKRYYRRRRPLPPCAYCGAAPVVHGNSRRCRPCLTAWRRLRARLRQRRYRERVRLSSTQEDRPK